MSYDLRRLRLKGVITRLPHTNTYLLTPDGLRVAVFYVKVHDRLLRPLLADAPPPSLAVRQALRTLDHHAVDYIEQARTAAWPHGRITELDSRVSHLATKSP